MTSTSWAGAARRVPLGRRRFASTSPTISASRRCRPSSSRASPWPPAEPPWKRWRSPESSRGFAPKAAPRRWCPRTRGRRRTCLGRPVGERTAGGRLPKTWPVNVGTQTCRITSASRARPGTPSALNLRRACSRRLLVAVRGGPCRAPPSPCCATRRTWTTSTRMDSLRPSSACTHSWGPPTTCIRTMNFCADGGRTSGIETSRLPSPKRTRSDMACRSTRSAGLGSWVGRV
mmetsp:Transcript_100318/g.259436  ORF Transcript_100318/g.259436 Transcript_100318/m.259436 type:complete len:232 (-) Transcript_100318:677-1372(-)